MHNHTNNHADRCNIKVNSARILRSCFVVMFLPMLLLAHPAYAQQVIDNVDLDGLGKTAIVVRSTTTTPELRAGRYSIGSSTFTFTVINDPGINYRLLGANKIDTGAKSDLLFQNIVTGDFGEASAWLDFDSTKQRLVRNVKRIWDVQAVGDLDGDGFGDLVWRYLGFDPLRPNDTGVSYIWFTSGAPSTSGPNVSGVRKRGGAPLTWTLIGAADINSDGAADMVYLSPDGIIKVLMATPGRTCANLSAGNVPAGFTAQKLGNFSGDGRADILYRNAVTGAVQLAKLNAVGLTLPPFVINPLQDPQDAPCTASSLTVLSTTVSLPVADPTWLLYAVGDYDGNGTTDIVWLRPNGQLTVWLTNPNGAAPTEIANAGFAPFVAAATESGTLSDSAIVGVAYNTSSGVTGVTDVNGKYRFNVGDTVTFTLGTLALGTVIANGLISPIELSAGNANKLTNLLVLFQSLDSDGNAANGINITAPTAAAVTGAINLTTAPATFASAANTALQSAMTISGLTGAIKTIDQANTHFASQFFATVSTNVYGILSATGGAFVRIASNGEYLQGQAKPDVFSGTKKIEQTGVEYGIATVTEFDVNGYRLQGSAVVDTNLTAGISNPQATDRVNISTLPKIENIPGTIVGAWSVNSSTIVRTPTVVFGSNGKFMLVDPNGDPSDMPAKPGIEFGSYTYDASAKILKVSGALYDTNGNNGLLQSVAARSSGMTVNLNADGVTATFIDPSSVGQTLFTIYRISR